MIHIFCINLNRHERQDHPGFDPQLPVENNDEGNQKKLTPIDDSNDYLYNYHQQKLAFGLTLMAFEDAVKEGDGQRLFEIYKLTLLIFKAKGHPKYAYVNLLYLVKICAILPKFEAERIKWNRFVNNRGGKGLNIPLDLHKEHQNRFLKVMWRALGPNLNETSAARIAGTLEPMEHILEGIDKDCTLSEISSFRATKKKEEAVHQITSDLVSIDAFQYTRNRPGHPSFPNFESKIISGLDYRDLHQWMKEKVATWGSIYVP